MFVWVAPILLCSSTERNTMVDLPFIGRPLEGDEVTGCLLGIGTDMVEISAFREQWTTPGSRFSQPGAIFAPREIRRAHVRAQEKGDDAADHLAAVWAIKEATLKAWLGALSHLALPPPLRQDDVTWADIVVTHSLSGVPSVHLVGKMLRAFEASVGAAIAGAAGVDSREESTHKRTRVHPPLRTRDAPRESVRKEKRKRAQRRKYLGKEREARTHTRLLPGMFPPPTTETTRSASWFSPGRPHRSCLSLLERNLSFRCATPPRLCRRARVGFLHACKTPGHAPAAL